jgi:hypothetical protein
MTQIEMERSVVEGGERDQDPDAPPTLHLKVRDLPDNHFTWVNADDGFSDACTSESETDSNPGEESPDGGEGEEISDDHGSICLKCYGFIPQFCLRGSLRKLVVNIFR